MKCCVYCQHITELYKDLKHHATVDLWPLLHSQLIDLKVKVIMFFLLLLFVLITYKGNDGMEWWSMWNYSNRLWPFKHVIIWICVQCLWRSIIFLKNKINMWSKTFFTWYLLLKILTNLLNNEMNKLKKLKK